MRAPISPTIRKALSDERSAEKLDRAIHSEAIVAFEVEGKSYFLSPTGSELSKDTRAKINEILEASG